MCGEDEGLALWERSLNRIELDLLEREQQALVDDPTAAELAALADARDRVARDRDVVAAAHEEQATARDHQALRRDLAGSGRDRRARAREQDLDPGAPDRLIAGEDRDLAAGDRADSHDDRRRGRKDRERAALNRDRAAADRDQAAQRAAEQDRELDGLRRALESRLVIGQAQGLIMAWHRLSADAAFAVLIRLSQERNIKLREVAGQVVDSADATVTKQASAHDMLGPPG